MLTFEQLEALRSIVRAGTFGRAADEMFLSQPALSVRIRHLESALGTRILQRSPGRHGIRLTAAGEMALHFAEEMVALREQLAEGIRRVSDEAHATINIACAVIPAKYILPDMLESYHRRHPRAHVNLIEATGEKICALLQNGTVELGILTDNYIVNDFQRIPLACEAAVLIGSHGHPVLSDPQQWLIDNRPCPVITGPPNSLGRVLTERWAAELRLDLDVVVETTSMNVIKEAVMRGIGLAVLPEVAVREEVSDGRLAVVPVNGKPLDWRVSVILDPKRSLSPAAEAFLEVALDQRILASTPGLPIAASRRNAHNVAAQALRSPFTARCPQD